MLSRHALLGLVVLGWGLVGPAAGGEENAGESRVVWVGLFKNGLAVVQRTVELGAGTTRVENVPTPVHGTFWIESAGGVAAVVTSREVDAPVRGRADLDFQQALVGRQVTVFFREGNIPPAVGKVVEVARPKGGEAWSRSYQPRSYYGYYGDGAAPAAGGGQFLILETAKGRSYVETGMVAYIAAEGTGATVRQRRPVLLLTPEDGKKPAGPATISYLTKGLAWAPAYRVSVVDGKTLRVEQQAVIKNEMEDLKDVEMRLISGFPSVQFAHVTSPMALDTTWASFFTQLNQRVEGPRGALGNAMAQQQAVAYNGAGPDAGGVDLSATPTGDGVDLHFQGIGKRTLAEGDSLTVPVAAGQADYERIVEWVVPDTRDENGRHVEEYQRQQNPDKYDDAPWDALRFKNPLPFAMTTGPAMIVANGTFAGQRLSYWVNAGEQTTLRVTKALSLRTRAVEQEDQAAGRDIVSVGGRTFRKVPVKGELTLNNHRKEEVKVVVRRQFSGELAQADGDPKVVLREEGVYSVNKRNELVWEVKLAGGEQKTLTYRYEVLVYH